MQNTMKWGGLKHIHIKHIMHKIRVKWMIYLWDDQGKTWSLWIWPGIQVVILVKVLPGMTYCAEHLLKGILPFYRAVLRSYAYINHLDIRPNKPRNIWATELTPGINRNLVSMGIVQIGDILVQTNFVDLQVVKM